MTLNVQGCRNKMEEIMKEVDTMKLDLIILTETKKNGTGNDTLGSYIHRYSGVDKHRRAKKRSSNFDS